MMTIIDAFCAAVNQNLDDAEAAYALALAGAERAQDRAALDNVYGQFRSAREPRHFYHVRVSAADARLDRVCDLMEAVFEPELLDSRSGYVDAYTGLDGLPDTFRHVMLARCFQTPAGCVYSADGRLERFAYDPAVVAEHVVSMVSGGYHSFGAARPARGIGGIGYAATRPAFREQKHGLELVRLYEDTVRRIAAAHGEKLELIALEAEKDAVHFWRKMGFAYPAGSVYFQPPIEFDLQTGEPVTGDVPEVFMVKLADGGESIERGLLLETVRLLYEDWYIPRGASPAAGERIRAHVMGRDYALFAESLPPGDYIPLTIPPET